MAFMLSSLYDALLEAGASEEKARKAGEEAASYDARFQSIERKLDVLTWMVGFNLIFTNLVFTLGVLWRLLTH